MTIDFNQVLKVEILESTRWSAWNATLMRLFTGFGWNTIAMPYYCIMVCNESELT